MEARTSDLNMDVAFIRKRLKQEVEQARRTAAERRERAKTTNRAYDQFLAEVAVPVFRQMATVLRAEGIPFDVQTPSGGVRLVSDRNRDEGIGLELDATQDPPQVVMSSIRTWGSRVLQNERSISNRDKPVERLTDEDLFERLLEEIRPWLV
jgi:hypothetical protein